MASKSSLKGRVEATINALREAKRTAQEKAARERERQEREIANDICERLPDYIKQAAELNKDYVVLDENPFGYSSRSGSRAVGLEGLGKSSNIASQFAECTGAASHIIEILSNAGLAAHLCIREDTDESLRLVFIFTL